MKTIPITMLVHDGPIGRAYLSRMRQSGLWPGAMILMVYSHRPGSKTALGRWLPGSIRRWYAEKHQELSHNYWPRQLKKTCPALFDSMIEPLRAITDDPAGLLEQMLGKFEYDGFVDCKFTKVFLKDWRDEALIKAIEAAPYPTVLYTGGGIVPASILSLPGIRVLHAHPGHLPDVRGADGVLWSTLVRGCPGASCFFFAEAIDTGPIITAQDFPPVTFRMPEGTERPDDETLYRALFSYYDPILRAEMLVKVLERFADAGELPAQEQDTSVGVTYHFMHPALRREALNKLFVPS